MKNFKYTGSSVMNFTLNKNRENTDFCLVPNESYDLPEDNDHIKTLIGKGYLIEVVETKKDTKNDKK